MILRQIVRTLLNRAAPAMYATSFLFENQSETQRPTENDKLNLEPPDIKKLTAEYMIQQTIVNSINNATQTLNVAYMAVMRISSEYKSSLNKLIILMNETLEYHVSDEHWDLIVATRSEVQSKKEKLNKLTGYVQYVHRLAVAALDLSYLSDMDNLSFSLSMQVQNIEKNIQEEIERITVLEQEYADVQIECIRSSNKENSNKPTN